MPGFTKVLVLLAAATFVLAAVGNLFTGAIFVVTPEGLSRACTNLALLAIAIAVVHDGKSVTG